MNDYITQPQKLAIRFLNVTCAAAIVGLEIWFLIKLFSEETKLFNLIARMLLPFMVMYFSH